MQSSGGTLKIMKCRSDIPYYHSDSADSDVLRLRLLTFLSKFSHVDLFEITITAPDLLHETTSTTCYNPETKEHENSNHCHYTNTLNIFIRRANTCAIFGSA